MRLHAAERVTLIGLFSGKYGTISSEFGPSVGAVFNTRRAPFPLGRAVLYVNCTGLELLAGLDSPRPGHLKSTLRMFGLKLRRSKKHQDDDETYW